jgi:PAS domain S-box-containing protein
LALVAAAIAPTLLLRPLLERSAFLLFTGAVVVSAALWGMRAGLTATAASLLCAVVFIDPLRGSWLDGGELIRLGTFVFLSVWVSILSHRMWSLWRKAREDDVSLRRSEERYRRIVDLADEGILSLDTLGQTTYVNRRLLEMLGLDYSQLAGRKIVDLVPAEWQDRTRALWKEVRSGHTVRVELPLVRANGETVWANVACTPMFADGVFQGAVSMLTDVTEPKRDREIRERVEKERAALLQDAERARGEAEAANRMKDEFLATLSHELRTPLTSIVGWTKMLRSGQLDPETTTRAIETIDRNARLQTRLIADVLDLSRIVSGKLRLHMTPMELAPIIDAVLDTLRPVAEAKGITLRRAVDERHCPVSGDPDRLQQVVWNLISNALKFTPRGGVVEVGVRCREGEAEISVSDTGIGIGHELLPHVFERFRQGDASSTRSYGGLGLGLAIVRHLVELHGGRVSAHSGGLGQGATFRVRLPRLVEPVAPGAEEAERRRAGDAEGVPRTARNILSGIRVLVVDDEPDARDLVATVLEHQGAEVKTAESAAEALGLVERLRPDVLLSDIEMPGESGYALIHNVRKLPAERGGRVPAAALTAYARLEDRTRALRAGFQMHVPKPLNPTELATIVASLAGRLEQAAP